MYVMVDLVTNKHGEWRVKGWVGVCGKERDGWKEEAEEEKEKEAEEKEQEDFSKRNSNHTKWKYVRSSVSSISLSRTEQVRTERDKSGIVLYCIVAQIYVLYNINPLYKIDILFSFFVLPFLFFPPVSLSLPFAFYFSHILHRTPALLTIFQFIV